MGRFLTGILVGGLVAVLGLITISQLAPMGGPGDSGASRTATPDQTEPAADAAANAATDAATGATGAEQPTGDTGASSPDPTSAAATVPDTDSAATTAATDTPAADASAPSATAPSATAPSASAPSAASAEPAAQTLDQQPASEAIAPPAAETSAPVVASPDVPASPALAAPKPPASDPPAMQQATDADPALSVPAADGSAPAPAPGGAAPAVMTSDPAVDAVVPPNPVPGALADAQLDGSTTAPAPDAQPATPDILADGATLPDAPAASPDAPATDPAPAEDHGSTLTDAAPSTLPADARIKDQATGVTTGRLPRIGDAAASAETVTADGASNAEDQPPLIRYAREYQADGKPMFALLLVDVGSAGIARAKLAELPFPVTFVIDPTAADAASAAAQYRAAGQEVAILASGIPLGATATDVEQSLQSLAATLPETVALVDLREAGFQGNRQVSQQIVGILQAQGRGLVTYDQGLNAADQVARRDGLAEAIIFRTLDAAGENAATIRRYLDRAAFRAAQEGSVVVIGDSSPETVAAILEWSVEGRAASMSMAPISAVLK